MSGNSSPHSRSSRPSPRLLSRNFIVLHLHLGIDLVRINVYEGCRSVPRFFFLFLRVDVQLLQPH